MARIDHYEFGRIMIDGRQETKDLIILPDRMVRNWWRQDGHTLVLDDLGEGPGRTPCPLGRRHRRRGPHAARSRHDPTAPGARCDRGGLPTSQAVRRFGELDPATTAAALHLTC